jgi:hypothetical protein
MCAYVKRKFKDRWVRWMCGATDPLDADYPGRPEAETESIHAVPLDAVVDRMAVPFFLFPFFFN